MIRFLVACLTLALTAEAVTSNYTLCNACQELVKAIEPIAKLPISVIEDIAIGVCITYEETSSSPECHGISQCTELCKGVVDEFAPMIVPLVLNHTLTPVQVCAAIDLCPVPVPPPQPGYYVPVPSNLSDTTGQKDWPSWSITKGTGTFLHISDLHYDPLYAEGSKTDCGQPLCCRAQWGQGGPNDSAGRFGDYNCDAPALLVNELFIYLNQSLSQRPDFILYTGDDPAHDIWNQDRNTSLNAVRYVQKLLQQYYPDVPVFANIGNHEAIPVNEFGGPTVDQWLYGALADIWSPYIPADAQKTLTYGGYYQALLRPGLRVIALHTTMFSPDNAYLSNYVYDFAHQLDWLNDTLRQVSERGEQAILIGHASPQDWYQIFANKFNQLMTTYRNQVVNMFFGHTHDNEVQLVQATVDSMQVPIIAGYIGGSVTPYTNINPGFSVFAYDRAAVSNNKKQPLSFLATDLSYYWMNLTESNENNQALFKQGVNALHSYGLKDLSPSSWYALAEQFKAGEAKDAFVAMQIAFTKGFTNGQGGNMKQQACEIETNNPDDLNACTSALNEKPRVRKHACSGEATKPPPALRRQKAMKNLHLADE